MLVARGRVASCILGDAWRLDPPDDGAVTEALFILCVVVAIALAFDFTNGFHDTANAMATSIATGALKPKAAVTLSAILNWSVRSCPSRWR